MDPLHATLEESNCPRSRCDLPSADQLPKISMGLTLDGLARRLRCAKCGGLLLSIKPWRQTDASGRPWGGPKKKARVGYQGSTRGKAGQVRRVERASRMVRSSLRRSESQLALVTVDSHRSRGRNHRTHDRNHRTRGRNHRMHDRNHRTRDLHPYRNRGLHSLTLARHHKTS